MRSIWLKEMRILQDIFLCLKFFNLTEFVFFSQILLSSSKENPLLVQDTRTTFTVPNFLNFVSSCFVLLKKEPLQLT